MSESLLAQVLEHVRQRRHFPEATYRLQFHAGFTFRDAAQILPYLRELGITHCYASPYLKARPGSTHGYDITDHRQLNPEIGSQEDYDAFVRTLKAQELGQILDTVPNHMGVGNDNPWWQDVLENGPASLYANYFDISWQVSPRPELQGRVLIPTLGGPYGKVLEAGELQLKLEDGAFAIWYYDHRFPVDPATYGLILGEREAELEKLLEPLDPALVEYQSILTAIRHLPPHTETEPTRMAERQREKEVIKRRLANLLHDNDIIRGFVEQNVQQLNGQPGDSRSFDRLDKLLDQQPYRLSFWRVASDEINYRRFFDINDLAALNMEREEVFADTHELILQLLAEGKLAGLRIDHPDGLYDPKQYLQRLQRHYLLACARTLFPDQSWEELRPRLLDEIIQAEDSDEVRRPLYVVVEKILALNEPLPEDWACHGTSGYDFLVMLNGLFADNANKQAFSRLYHAWIEDETRFPEVVYQKKALILRVSLASELQMLTHQLDRLAQKHRWSRDYTFNTLRHALREVIACFPVYRSYISDEGVRAADRQYIELAIRRARNRNPTMSRYIFQFVRDMLLLQFAEDATDDDRAEQRQLAGKFQQVTAPVTAKGIEDTAFYNYHRLISLNEVGGEPEHFGISPAELHRYLQDRQAKWPFSLSPLSTHDTKRSEDVRARIHVLSELPDEWRAWLTHWSRLNQRLRPQLEDQPVPDANEEYLLYQTLLGAWPLEPYSADEYAEFIRRIQAYMVKALHEAKVHTSWINPNVEYDNAIQDFVARILNEQENGEFLQDFRGCQRRISHYGLFNSLAQTLVRLTAPGVPDTYQGTELWDFSLVDPDNRRPVDYGRRSRMLHDLRERSGAGGDRKAWLRELVQQKEDGRIKLFVVWQTLCCRRAHAGLFSTGAYVAAQPTGSQADHVFGFARQSGEQQAIVAVPRLLTRLLPSTDAVPCGPDIWRDTRLTFPGVTGRFRNVFTGDTVSADGQGNFALAELCRDFPVALLLRE